MSEDLVLQAGWPNPLRKMVTVLGSSHGWVQNTLVYGLEQGPPRVCLMGAAGYVDAQDYEYYEMYVDEMAPPWLLLLGETIAELYPDRVARPWTGGVGVIDGIPRFNDDPMTTLDDVLAVCEKAAIRWEEQIS